MKKLNLADMQAVEINILKYIEKVSIRENIPYYLGFGSLLGAIRHQGFIPWDDDMDILVPRKYYEDFLQVLQDDPKYQVISMYNTKEYVNPWAKVIDKTTILLEREEKNVDGMGVFVDVFPLDNLPCKKFPQKVFFMRVRIFKWIRYFANKSKKEYEKAGILEKIKIRVAQLYGCKKALLQIDNMCKARKKDDSEFVGVPVVGTKSYIFHREDFLLKKYVAFSQERFPIPKGATNILKATYGDYMKMPPESERVIKHNFDAYYK